MYKVLAVAVKAEQNGEVPVGAVIIKEGKIIAKGYNRYINDKNPTAHAKIAALKKAAKKLKNYKLNGCSIYVIIEPCVMCAGALVNARLENIYFGAFDKKAGACKSAFKIANSKKLNHRMKVFGGIMEKECAGIIKKFFKNRR